MTIAATVEPPGQQHERGHAEGDRGTEGDHREQSGEQAEQRRMGNAGNRIGDAEDHALAEADEYQAVHRAVDRVDDLPPDILAGGTEGAAAADAELLDDVVGVPQAGRTRRAA